MSTPFSPLHETLMLIAAAVAVGIGGWNLLHAFHPRWRNEAFRFTPIIQALLLLLFAAVLVLVVFAFPAVGRYGIWLPLAAVIGLTLQRLAFELDERKPRADECPQTDASATQPAGGPRESRPSPVLVREQKPRPYLLWAGVLIGAGWLIIGLRQTYIALAVGVGFFLLFVVPAKDRSTVANLFGVIAAWGVPTLFLGIKAAQFLILCSLYGVGPVWSGSISVSRMPRDEWFIQLSNGDQFHDAQVFLWRFAVFVMVVLFGMCWMLLLVWLSKRLYPPWYDFARQQWQQFRKPGVLPA